MLKQPPTPGRARGMGGTCRGWGRVKQWCAEDGRSGLKQELGNGEGVVKVVEAVELGGMGFIKFCVATNHLKRCMGIAQDPGHAAQLDSHSVVGLGNNTNDMSQDGRSC
ncbi:hypothetical protein HaLaN_31668, partial [Haematococcus lacustris]